jgi:single-strand DNA-binding protein
MVPAKEGVNHCLLEVEVLEAPQVRYTQDNQTPVAELVARFDGLRAEDPPGQIKVVGWGNLATDLQNRVQVGQRWVMEGRLRMNTVTRQDGVKEKRAELTLARLHALAGASPAASVAGGAPLAPVASRAPVAAPAARGAGAPPPPARKAGGRAVQAEGAGEAPGKSAPPPVWNTSPLVPDDLSEGDDDIPF